MKKVILSAFSLLLSFISISALAQNYQFLRDAAVTRFTDEDAKIYANTQENALNKAKDGAKVSWSNPKTTARGYFIPSKTTKMNGNTCRKLTIFNYADHRSGQAVFKFCKMNGAWKIVS